MPNIELPEIHILLYRGHGLLSTLIRWQTDGRVAHSALRNKGEVIEATPWRGVVKRPYALADAVWAEAYVIPSLSPAHWNLAWDFANAQLGKKYDWLGIFRFLTRNKDQNPKRWFCSELVFAALAYGYLELLARVPAYKVSPEAIRRSPLCTLPI
jgi:hypothetical protein